MTFLLIVVAIFLAGLGTVAAVVIVSLVREWINAWSERRP